MGQQGRAPLSAAFYLTLLNCFTGLLLVVTTVFALAKPGALDDARWVLGELQESMARVGLVASVAMLFAFRRVAIRLGAPRLRTMAVTTLWLQLAGYLPTVALQWMQERWSDAEPSQAVVIALGLLGLALGIAAWSYLLVALRELRATLSGSALADAFRMPPHDQGTP